MTTAQGLSAEPPAITLDPVDNALIDLLREDGRITFSDMGKEVNLSGEASRHRIERLERSGVIKIVGSVSPEVLGFESFALVAINVDTSATAVAETLAAFSAADFVVSTAGEFDVLAEVVCRDDNELLEVLDAIRAVPGVQRCQTFLYLSFNKYAYDQSPAGHGEPDRPSPRPQTPPPPLDDADAAIIAALREDGRASYTYLASISGMTYPSARRRVLRLRESGILHIRTIVNPIVSRKQVQAGIGVKVARNIRSVADQLQLLPEVGMVLTTTGPHDLMLEVTCKDKPDLADFVGERLRSIEDVMATHTYTYLHIHKLAYTWSDLTQ